MLHQTKSSLYEAVKRVCPFLNQALNSRWRQKLRPVTPLQQLALCVDATPILIFRPTVFLLL
jgi:hypothetical protein